MSILNVDEIRDATSSTTIAPDIPALEPRLPQAWVNFGGAGVASVRSSFNVSSVTYTGTGRYTINFISPMNSALNYCFVMGVQSGAAITIRGSATTLNTASALYVETLNPPQTAFIDAANGNVVVYEN